MANTTTFRQGKDPRRHVFTREQQQLGYYRAVYEAEGHDPVVVYKKVLARYKRLGLYKKGIHR